MSSFVDKVALMAIASQHHKAKSVIGEKRVDAIASTD
jgi:hypothetical protein